MEANQNMKSCIQINPIKNNSQRGKDLISNMPDEIIQHILSFLSTKRSIRTCLLSKRWETIWTSVPTLSFNYPDKLLEKHASFIDKTLSRYRASRIRNFSLRVHLRCGSRLDLWVKFATSHHVEDLILYVNYGLDSYSYCIPQILFDHSCLVNLSLMQCTLLPTKCVSWKLLKKLHLTYATLSSEAIGYILSGSPLLQILNLFCCHGDFKRIASTSLKKLTCWPLNGSLEINAPHLEYLSIHRSYCKHSHIQIYTPRLHYLKLNGCMLASKYTLIDVSSLLEAKLTFLIDDLFECRAIMKELIEQLYHVPKISLGMSSLMFLSTRELEGLSLRPLKWKTLILDVHIMNCCFPAMLHLLKGLPNLTKLTVNLRRDVQDKYVIGDANIFGHYNLGEGEEWISRMKTITCPLLHLNVIEITGESEYLRSTKARLIIDFLIRNSSVLTKIVTIEKEQ